jgi:formylglycine-generating enzyme
MRILMIVILLLVQIAGLYSQYSRPDRDGPGTEHEMVFVPGGTFMMGDLFFEYNTDALPVHEVALPDFYIGKYPVTFQEFDRFAGKTGRSLPNDNDDGRGNRAVVNVTWYDALEFCRSLGYRLPTEQEWEYAARSGGRIEMFSGTNRRDSLNYFAHFQFNSRPVSQPVGTKKPNGLGIYDMSGNVFEWIGEWYDIYRTIPRWIRLYPIDEKNLRVIRGGSAMQLPFTIRTYWRVYTFSDTRSREIGFRCAADTSHAEGSR